MTPDSIANLERWYDAGTLMLSHGDPVATWSDLSGVGADVVSSGALRPTFVTDRWNGLPGVLFSGAQLLSSTDVTGLPTSGVTVFAVASMFKRGSFPQLVCWGSANNSKGWALYNYTGGGNPTYHAPAMICLASGSTWGNNFANSNIQIHRGDPLILCGWRNGATTAVRVDGSETTDAGDTGDIDYAGNTTLVLGDGEASTAYPLQGILYEVAVYSRALGTGEIRSVEDYLDAKWKVKRPNAETLVMFNGKREANLYGIGFGWSPDGRSYRRNITNPVISTGLGWESGAVKDPCLLHDGKQFVCYYAGLGSAYQIGFATSSDCVTWAKSVSNPVLTVGTAGAIDDAGCSFPVVVKDNDEPDPTRRWKAWYSAEKAGYGYTIAYAYSSDGVSWTKHGRVIDLGSAGQFDDVGIIAGCVIKHNGVWHLYYSGWQSASDPLRFQVGLATFTNPESTYEKWGQNPILLSDFNVPAKAQSLTANTSAGSRTVTVASTAAFIVGEQLCMASATADPEQHRVLSIDSTTQLTLELPVVSSFTTAAGARIASYAYNCLHPRNARVLRNGTIELGVTPFRPVEDTGRAFLREVSQRAILTSAANRGALDHTTGHMFMVDDADMWCGISAENPSVLQLSEFGSGSLRRRRGRGAGW